VHFAVEALRCHRAAQLQARLLAGPEWEDHDCVFCTSFGRPLEQSSLVRRSFWPLLEKASLPRIRFHDLRQSVATTTFALKTDPKTVQAQLGHSRASTTLDIYTHAAPAVQAEAVCKLADLLAADGV